MSYAVALGLDQALVARLKQIGPSCYSADLDDCLDGKRPGYAHCVELAAAYDQHDDEWHAYTDALRWCPLCYEGPAAEAQQRLEQSVSRGILAVAALGALAAGMVLGVALYGIG